MAALGLLRCFAKALVWQGGQGAGTDIAAVAREVWREWIRVANERRRQTEVEAILQMAARYFDLQVAEVICEVAGGQPECVLRYVESCLQKLPERLRELFARVPASAEVPFRQSQDLIPMLTALLPHLLPPARVILTLAAGTAKGQTFVFEERTTCILGRADECYPLPRDVQHRSVSRHHCLLDINPPDVCVRDLGSRNGTYVNGRLIGQRPEGMDAEQGRQLPPFPEQDLKDGDELRLCDTGPAVFRVSVYVPALCIGCGVWIADEDRESCERLPGVYQCPACSAKATTDPPRRPVRACAHCGRDVAGESGTHRPGAYLCAACRQNPRQLLGDWLAQAPRRASEPGAIQGYTLLRELGRGGMGSVWLAQQNQTGRLVALKVLLPRVAAEERAIQSFLREVDSTRRLNHRNVVRLEDAGYARGTFFLILEYCDGGSVAGLMQQRGGSLDLYEAVEISLGALEGLHHAHENGLVHRDIKPGNLLLSGSGSARITKVGDYGLAKAFDDAGLSGGTRTGEVIGTPFFMPRQQVIDFKYARPEVDVWALAASLYNMLTGAFPREFPPGRDPWLEVVESRPIPIRQRKPSLPEKLAALIDRALQEEPEIPFKSAAELKAALEDAL
jgi:serine/threonine-protein kinase